MDNDDKRGRRMFRLIRISLILMGLFLVAVVLHPEHFLPPDMTLGEFFQALLGVLMLSGVFAAAAFRAWNDYQKKKRDRQ